MTNKCLTEFPRDLMHDALLYYHFIYRLHCIILKVRDVCWQFTWKILHRNWGLWKWEWKCYRCHLYMIPQQTRWSYASGTFHPVFFCAVGKECNHFSLFHFAWIPCKCFDTARVHFWNTSQFTKDLARNAWTASFLTFEVIYSVYVRTPPRILNGVEVVNSNDSFPQIVDLFWKVSRTYDILSKIRHLHIAYIG